MDIQKIIVIGASAGGFEPIKKIVAALPADFAPPIFIVWHISPDADGVMPAVLNKLCPIHAAFAQDGETIQNNRIYIAPPNHHMLLEPGRVRITNGPKENRFRPAVDPLFRSAAYVYGPRVIGIILSGALDDGTAGLWMIKNKGGIAVVQEPSDAEVASMPASAMRAVAVDHSVPIAAMGDLLKELAKEQPAQTTQMANEENDNRTALEIRIAASDNGFEQGIMNFGALSPFTCPECSGVLMAFKEGHRTRYRCHTGHAFSADTLLAAVTGQVEESLWNAIRAVEESVMLLNHMGDHFAEDNQPHLAAVFFKKAGEAAGRAELMRLAVLKHEQLSAEKLRIEAEGEENTPA